MFNNHFSTVQQIEDRKAALLHEAEQARIAQSLDEGKRFYDGALTALGRELVRVGTNLQARRESLREDYLPDELALGGR
jgi:hypothetical protein